MPNLETVKPAEIKSKFAAFLCVFLLGPIGGLYVGVLYAAIYLVILIVITGFAGIIGAAAVWAVYLVLTPDAVTRQNSDEIERVGREEEAIMDEHRTRELEERRHQELLAAVKEGNMKKLSDIEL